MKPLSSQNNIKEFRNIGIMKHVKVSELEKVPLFLEPTKEIRDLIREGRRRFGKQYLKEIQRKETTLWYYLAGKYTIPIHVIRETCRLLNKDFMNFLDGKRIHAGSHSKHSDIFSLDGLKLDSYKSLVLGCIPTEAHLRTDSICVNIVQNTEEPLKIIKKLILEQYPNVEKGNARIKDTLIGNTRYPLLNIKSPFYRWLLVEKYEIEIGKGTYNRKVPKEILESKDEEIILGFLGGVFSLEAGFSIYHHVKGTYNAILSLEMASKEFVESIRKIMNKRGYLPSKIEKSRTCWRFRLYRNKDIVKLLYDIFPWFIHRPKLVKKRKCGKTFLEVMKPVIGGEYIRNSKILKLVREARKKAGTGRNLVKIINKELNLNYSKRLVERWLGENNKLNLRVIYFLNKFVGNPAIKLFEDEILPKEYSFLFYINNFISKEEFEKIRGKKLLIGVC